MIKELVKPPKRILHNLLLTPEEYKQIKKNAELYAGGNVSGWLRYTGMKYAPKHNELIKK